MPEALKLKPGTVTTLRNELGRVINYYNVASGGAVFVAAADLLGSTSVNKMADGFAGGYWNAATNLESRTMSIGGICEDGIAGVCSGLSSYGRHIGVGASYAAFIAPLGSHLRAPARDRQSGADVGERRTVPADDPGLRPRGTDDRRRRPDARRSAGAPGAAGELPARDVDHAHPVGPGRDLDADVGRALAAAPALIAPFVTRPNVTVPDRAKLGLAPVSAARTGVYRLRAPKGRADVVVVLQECGVTMEFVSEVLPRLEKDGIDVDAYYVASSELFTALPLDADSRASFPKRSRKKAMGITGFTMVTMCRWVRSYRGRWPRLFPYRHGHYLGSGPATDGAWPKPASTGSRSVKAIRRYLDTKSRPGWGSPR